MHLCACQEVGSQHAWSNVFALKGEASSTQSPSELILNHRLDFNAHCKVKFGEYVQMHEEHNISMLACTIGAIATSSIGKSQGGDYFFQCDTGRHINLQDWTLLSMPQEVINQVHCLA